GPGLGGVVEDGVGAARGGHDGVGVGQVAAHLAHAQRVQLRVVAAVEAGDLKPAFHQAAAQGLAKEAAAAGDQDLHRPSSRAAPCPAGLRASCARAHLASCGRPILALWRMSTGKPGWNRKVSTFAVCTWPSPRWRSSATMRGYWS